MKYQGREILPSDRKGKKYMINYNGKWIHFGAEGMSDYTIHKDEARRQRYIKRAGNIRDGKGNLTRDNPESGNYYAMRVLWNYDPKKDKKLLE